MMGSLYCPFCEAKVPRGRVGVIGYKCKCGAEYYGGRKWHGAIVTGIRIDPRDPRLDVAEFGRKSACV